MQAERVWLRWVRRKAAEARSRAEVRLGIGDDAALIRPRRGWEIAITTDLLIEDVHFLRARDSAATCGRRLATRALSDLAAMGAEPLALFVSTAFPDDLPAAWARGLYRGLLAAGNEAGAKLAGGDVSASPAGKIFLDVVGVGQTPPGAALRRSGARPGDRIFVSGTLGLGALGRELAHSGRRARNASERRALAHHRKPQARWRLGLTLRGRAGAAIDISDGLATDLDHLCRESGVGAEIFAEALPLAFSTGGGQEEALRRALYGGEDYELLFTLPEAGVRAPAGVHEIGRVIARAGANARTGAGVRLQHFDGRWERLRPRGWEHFRRG